MKCGAGADFPKSLPTVVGGGLRQTTGSDKTRMECVQMRTETGDVKGIENALLKPHTASCNGCVAFV